MQAAVISYLEAMLNTRYFRKNVKTSQKLTIIAREPSAGYQRDGKHAYCWPGSQPHKAKTESKKSGS